MSKLSTVLVTGGSRGLGLGIVTQLSAGGYRVIAVARSHTDQLSKAVEAARERNRGPIEFQPYDLSDTDNMGRLVRDLRSTFGPLHGLVNNAGIGTPGLLATMPTAAIERLVRINTVAPLVLTKYVVRHMMADGGGRIVNVASIVAFTGYKALSAYSATKASMIGFTRSLAREVGPLGICVNAVAPGFLATEMTDEMSPSQQKQIARRSALHRMADVDDVAKSVEFLLGDAGRNITGTVITIDAGSTA